MSGIAGLVSAPGRPVSLSHFWTSLQLVRRCNPLRSSACEWRNQSGLQQLDLGREPVDSQIALQAVVGFCWDSDALPEASPERLEIFAAHDSELTNLAELAREIGLPRSAPCSLVLSRSMEKWGSGLFARLKGPFVVAVLQPSSGHLLLARDRLGIKPLFYHWDPGAGFHFSSQVVSLLSLGRLPRQINPSQLWDYLTSVDLSRSEETLFRGVKEAPAGAVLKIPLDGRGAPETIPFGSFPPEETKCSVTQAAGRLKELLFESVRQRTSGVSGLGITLSGGIDSSAVAASAVQVRSPGQPLHAFTFAPDPEGPKYAWSEEPRARAVAHSLGIPIHSVSLSSGQIVADFEDLIEALEFPFSSPVLFANLQLLRAAAGSGVGLVLNGHGPDLLFAGASGHIPARAAGMVRRLQLLSAWRTLRTAHPPGGKGSLQTLRTAAGICLPSVRRAFRNRVGPAEIHPTIQRAWFAERLGPPERLSDAGGKLDLRSMRLDELTRSVLPRFMRYESATSALAQVRNTSPFLADEVVDFALALPVECLIAEDGLSKVVLREAMQGLLPDDVLRFRERVGFPVPLEQWLLDSADWAREQLLRASRLPFLDGAEVCRHSDRFFAAGSIASWNSAMALWKLILLSGWIQVLGLSVD